MRFFLTSIALFALIPAPAVAQTPTVTAITNLSSVPQTGTIMRGGQPVPFAAYIAQLEAIVHQGAPR